MKSLSILFFCEVLCENTYWVELGTTRIIKFYSLYQNGGNRYFIFAYCHNTSSLLSWPRMICLINECVHHFFSFSNGHTDSETIGTPMPLPLFFTTVKLEMTSPLDLSKHGLIVFIKPTNWEGMEVYFFQFIPGWARNGEVGALEEGSAEQRASLKEDTWVPHRI